MAVPGGGVASASSWNDLMVLLGVMGMQLALVHISAAEPLPHLSFKNTPIKGMSKCVHRDCLDHWRAIKVISVLAYLVHFIDGYQNYWLRTAWGCDNEVSFYYICDTQRAWSLMMPFILQFLLKKI
ncbi:hypothetical protein GUJ93_ZPchr0014g47044 [Zizania palustris]|uniref:Uncharacterized protein n=1 Tax=Zizania palustris TaxID=103762 RepID=A0A8J5SWB5_ZIZPA|nr:hypothetical protein GUJ93_ZPchr0014g47044 [Zizania palustris]